MNFEPLPALCQAAMDGDEAGVHSLLESDNNYNINECDFEKTTVLMWACDGGYTDIVRYLLERGADDLLVNSNGMTAREFAVSGGHHEVVKLLGKVR